MNRCKKDALEFTPISFIFASGPFDGQNYLAASPKWLQNLAFFCLCVYAYSWYLFNDFADIFSILLVLIGTYLYWKKRHPAPVWKDPIIQVLIAAIFVQLLSWYIASQSHPNLSDSSPKVHRMGIWFKMIPIAIIVAARTDRVILCWLLALAALLSASFIHSGGFSEWQSGLAGNRIDFGINNAQHTSMLGGILALSALAAFTINFKLSFTKRCWLYMLLLFALLSTSAIVIFSQTRAVWLGLMVAIPILMFFMLLTNKQRLSSMIPKILIGACIVIVALASFQGIFKGRAASLINALNSSDNVIQMILKDRSFELRLSTWKEGIEWIEKRPLFGWGGDIEKHIVTAAAEKTKEPITFNHLHNSYIETLANYGIFGFSILLLLCGYLSYCAYKSWKFNVMPTPIYLFLTGLLPFWVIINLTESYFYYSSGEYVLAIVGGVILSYYWKHMIQVYSKDKI